MFFLGQELPTDNVGGLGGDIEEQKCFCVVGNSPQNLSTLSTDLFTGGIMIVLELWEIVLFSLVLAICIGLYFDN